MHEPNAPRLIPQQTRRRSEPRRSMAQATTALALALALLLALAITGTALAAPPTERSMQLACEDSELVIMRSNGSSWWGIGADGQPDGTVYITRTLDITSDGETVYSKSYGNKTALGPSTTCTADHLGFLWVIELVQAT